MSGETGKILYVIKRLEKDAEEKIKKINSNKAFWPCLV